jgi:putative nucleotidyltransferase with HDIG domain
MWEWPEQWHPLEPETSSECSDFAVQHLWKSRQFPAESAHHVAQNRTGRAEYKENRDKNMNDRAAAWGLLTEFTQSESLRKHALSVEACMRAYAEKFGGDVELWGVVGLLHDFDYDKYPSLDDHPYKGNEILKDRGWPEEIRRAILSHASYSGVTRDSQMEKALFACDELSGFITACALVKPSKSLAEVEAKSVKKKMKDKAFARSVNRDDITDGAASLGVELEDHIAFCIQAMQKISGTLGL